MMTPVGNPSDGGWPLSRDSPACTGRYRAGGLPFYRSFGNKAPSSSCLMGRPAQTDFTLAFISSQHLGQPGIGETAVLPTHPEFSLTGLSAPSKICMTKRVTLARNLLTRWLGRLGPLLTADVDRALVRSLGITTAIYREEGRREERVGLVALYRTGGAVALRADLGAPTPPREALFGRIGTKGAGLERALEVSPCGGVSVRSRLQEITNTVRDILADLVVTVAGLAGLAAKAIGGGQLLGEKGLLGVERGDTAQVMLSVGFFEFRLHVLEPAFIGGARLRVDRRTRIGSAQRTARGAEALLRRRRGGRRIGEQEQIEHMELRPRIVHQRRQIVHAFGVFEAAFLPVVDQRPVVAVATEHVGGWGPRIRD